MRCRIANSLVWSEPPSGDDPGRFQAKRLGISLIELLVVMAIIGVLVGVLLPALAQARRQAVTTQCLANCRQIAMAALSYEMDHGRLPPHVAESGTSNLAHAVRSAGLDARPLYSDYMSVDHFRCPHLPSWRPSEATAVNVHANYILPAGYFADYESGDWTPQRWIRSDRPWRFNGHPVQVLVMDRSYGFHNPATGMYANIVNHGGQGFQIQNVDTPMNRGVANLTLDPTDLRRRFDFNAAFADGGARTFDGSDPSVIEVPDRDPTKNGTYLIPSP